MKTSKQGLFIDFDDDSRIKEFTETSTDNKKCINDEEPNLLIGKTEEGEIVKSAIDPKCSGSPSANTFVIGGSGFGKTASYLIPLILQCNSSFVVCDPTQEMLSVVGPILENHNYKINVLSHKDLKNSRSYNPMDYVYSADGIPDNSRIHALAKNIVSSFLQDETFYYEATLSLVEAVIHYCIDFMPEEKRNLKTICDLISVGLKESQNNDETELDALFKKAFTENPKSKAFYFYKRFKFLCEKTARSIIIVFMANFGGWLHNSEYLELVGVNNSERKKIDIREAGNRKTAIFVDFGFDGNIPLFKFLTKSIYQQLSIELTDVVRETKKKLPVHFRFIVSQEVPQPESFDGHMASFVKRYNMSKTYVYDSVGQAKACIKDMMEFEMYGCSQVIFLGSFDFETCEWFAKMLRMGCEGIEEMMNLGKEHEIAICRNHSGEHFFLLRKLNFKDHPFYKQIYET